MTAALHLADNNFTLYKVIWTKYLEDTVPVKWITWYEMPVFLLKLHSNLSVKTQRSQVNLQINSSQILNLIV